MKALIIDLTHGGVKIAIELSKLGYFNEIFSFDIYKTLKNNEKDLLKSKNINLIDSITSFKNEIKEKNINSSELTIVSPVHCPLTAQKIRNILKLENNKVIKTQNNLKLENNNSKSDYYQNFEEKTNNNLNHHEAVKLILAKWKLETTNNNIPIIEVTGVKGKTSTIIMLKEILIDSNPLILSSLGSYLYKNNKSIELKENISITPASILKTVELAEKIVNPEDNDLNAKLNFNYNSCIFESSLGVTGIGNIGILTNIVENYPIAKNTSNAKEAKEQIFNCDFIVAESETLANYYKKKAIKEKNRINKFTLSQNPKIKNNSNLVVNKIKYGSDKTELYLNFRNIKTIYGKKINGSLSIKTFAPGNHHVLNILGVVTAALTLEIDDEIIQEKLNNFKGIKGRSSQKIERGFKIIEEINPGINIKAIESSINMIKNLDEYCIIIGGRYGITCEEINEKDLAILLNNYINEKNINLILTDELGFGIKNRMKINVSHIENPIKAQKIAIENNKNVLFIYRSNYSQLNKR
ncbi:MAG: coenzyme F430 synthase [Methanobacteriaceae archaeon]|jgi:UDP-N-acetylmuramyl pentapeptide synthase|nr:coenzyme F430 synthase [Candidatus Methanorudis spinitermitis]